MNRSFHSCVSGSYTYYIFYISTPHLKQSPLYRQKKTSAHEELHLAEVNKMSKFCANVLDESFFVSPEIMCHDTTEYQNFDWNVMQTCLEQGIYISIMILIDVNCRTHKHSSQCHNTESYYAKIMDWCVV